MALEGPKIAPYTHTHLHTNTGVIVQQRERKRGSKNTQDRWRESTEKLKEEEEAVPKCASGTKNEKDMTQDE